MPTNSKDTQKFAVIGMGRFGSRIAGTLAGTGAEVVAIDRNRDLIEMMRDRVTVAVALDSTDEAAITMQGVDKVDVAVVAIGSDFESSVLTTVLLKQLGVKRVVSRTTSATQARILTRIGADSIVNPEDESADRWAHKLLTPFIIDHIQLSEGFGLIQLPTPAAWVDKPLAELGLRVEHHVNVVAIKHRVSTESETGEEHSSELVVEMPLPTSRLEANDILVVAGRDEDLEKLSV